MMPIAASIDPRLYAALPDFRAYGMRIALPDRGFNETAVSELRKLAIGTIQSLGSGQLGQHPRIAPWRAAYHQMRLKPSDYRSSIEQLLRRSETDGPRPTGNWLVDFYNLASVAFLAPIGAYDCMAMAGSQIAIRPLEMADRFEAIGVGPNKFPMSENVFGYAVGSEVMCWALNHRDSERFRLSQRTTDAIFFSECMDHQGADACVKALGSLARCLGSQNSPSRILEVKAQPAVIHF